MTQMKIFLSILMIASFATAQTAPIVKGQPSPFDGVVFSTEAAKKTKDELIEKDFLVEENKSLKRSIDLYKTKDEYSQNQIDKLLQANTKLVDSSFTENKYTPVIWFALGVFATGLSFYAAKKIVE